MVGIFSFPQVNASGSSYILMDASSTRIIKGDNIHKRLLTASICKMLTAIVTIENVDLNEEYVVTSDDLKTNGSSVYLVVGQKIKVVDLLYGLLLRSGNDCAKVLANHVFGDYDYFIYMMNEYAKTIGMTNSTFLNPSGLDDETQNYSTAYDMALLAGYVSHNEAYMKINGAKSHRISYNENTYVWGNKHRLITSNSTVIGGKTGYTKQALRTLVTIAKKDNMTLVCVTFRYSNDFNFHEALFNSCFKTHKSHLILEKGIYKPNIDVNYFPYVTNNVYMVLTDSETKKIKVIFKLKKDVNDSMICGYAEIYIDTQLCYKYPLSTYIPSETSQIEVWGKIYFK